MNPTNAKQIHIDDEYLTDQSQHLRTGLPKFEMIESLEITKEFVEHAHSVLRIFQNDENFQSMTFDQDSRQEIFNAIIEGILSNKSRPDVLEALANKIKTEL